MWLEQKVTEWGCMQALIDFEGWREWRGFTKASESEPEGANSNGGISTTQTPQMGASTKRPHALSTVLWSNGESKIGSPTHRARASSLSKKNGVPHGKDSPTGSTAPPSHEAQMFGTPSSGATGNKNTPTSASSRRSNRM